MAQRAGGSRSERELGMELNLDGQVAIVTGGGRGIGRRIETPLKTGNATATDWANSLPTSVTQ